MVWRRCVHLASEMERIEFFANHTPEKWLVATRWCIPSSAYYLDRLQCLKSSAAIHCICIIRFREFVGWKDDASIEFTDCGHSQSQLIDDTELAFRHSLSSGWPDRRYRKFNNNASWCRKWFITHYPQTIFIYLYSHSNDAICSFLSAPVVCCLLMCSQNTAMEQGYPTANALPRYTMQCDIVRLPTRDNCRFCWENN